MGQIRGDNSMDKNNDLEDELNNENLDFLEEEHDHSAASKNKNSSNNLINNINFQLIKNLGKTIIIVTIIGGVIFGLINKKSKNLLKNDSITKNNLNKQNENPKTALSIIETTKSISNSNANNITDNLEKSVSVSEINTSNISNNNSNNDISQLQEIGQIKLPQPVKNPNPNSTTSVPGTPSNVTNPEDPNSNNNLSWQDIKQSIENDTTTLQKQPNKTIPPIADNLINNQGKKPNTTNVNGFERTANNIQVKSAARSLL